MADDLLKELLTSPLEEPSRRERRAKRRRGEDGEGSPHGSRVTPDGSDDAGSRQEIPRVPLLWGLGSALVGAVIVIAAYAVAAEDAPPTTTIATTTTIAAAVDDGGPDGLPPDYVAVGDRLGMRVERILSRGDGVFVTVTTVVENSLDPAGTAGYQGGLWTLVLEDGRRVTSTFEAFDPLARGTLSVWFPQEGFVAGDVAGIELNGLATRTTAPVRAETEQTVVLEADESTAVALTPERFALDTGVTLTIDAFTLEPGGGRLLWSLEGDATATASVTPSLTVSNGDETIEVPLHVQSSGFTFFHPSIPGPIPTTSEEIGFRMVDGEQLPIGEDLTATIDLSVTWLTYDPTVVELPTDDALVTELGP